MHPKAEGMRVLSPKKEDVSRDARLSIAKYARNGSNCRFDPQEND
jgi:hypothetical protein